MEPQFQLRTVKEMPGMAEHVRQASQEAERMIQMKDRLQPRTLARTRRRLARVWEASYLPPGFSQDDALVSGMDAFHPDLVFRHSTEPGEIVLSAAPMALYTEEAIAPGALLQKLQIEGNEAYLLRGGWHIQVDDQGAVTEAGWNYGFRLKLILLMQAEEQVVTLIMRPSELVPEDELLAMAKSLSYRQGHTLHLPFVSTGS